MPFFLWVLIDTGVPPLIVVYRQRAAVNWAPRETVRALERVEINGPSGDNGDLPLLKVISRNKKKKMIFVFL